MRSVSAVRWSGSSSEILLKVFFTPQINWLSCPEADSTLVEQLIQHACSPIEASDRRRFSVSLFVVASISAK